jgi:DNA-binding CsgD family transcriptional regulator
MVVLARQFSNSSPTPLSRALRAYRQLDLGKPPQPRSTVRPKRSKILNQSELERLREAYLAGATGDELAADFKVNVQTARQHLKAMGVRLRGSQATAEEQREAIRLYAQGLSLESVARQLCIGSGSVRNCLLRAGVKMRDSHGREVVAS